MNQTFRRKWWFALILIPLLMAGAVWFVADSLIPRLLTIPERARVDHRETPEKYGIPFKKLDVATSEGFMLKGWFVPAQAAKPLGTVVVLHGKSSCKEHMLILARLLAPEEFNVILYDSRAQGESGGIFCTYGVREKDDLQRFLTEVRMRFGEPGPVSVIGTSFGAGVAIQAMAEYPGFCCGIICSPFCNLEEASRRQLENVIHFDWPWLLEHGLRVGEKEAGFSVASINPELTAAGVQCPVLVVHGEMDERFPAAWGRRMYAAFPSSQKEWYLARGNGHDDVFWFHDAPEVKRTMLRFLKKHVQPDGVMP